jgi:hypothetical protein
MPCWYISEENSLLIGVSDQKPLWQGEEVHSLGEDCGKVLALFMSPPLLPPYKISSM